MGPSVRCEPAILLLLFLLFFAVPVNGSADDGSNATERDLYGLENPYKVTLFIPSATMIHSDQIRDQVTTPDMDILFGTSYGLSLYNGTWSTRHINRDNITEGLMDEYITAIEFDNDGNLWIGYSGGIQIYNGRYYQTIRDQQILRETRIQDLQRWDDDMWVATGHAGIHRYRNGVWTWFQPMSKGGPGFYEIRAMALDPPPDDMLVITTYDAGIWVVESPDDPVIFRQVAPQEGTNGLLQQVRRNMNGDGVYLFNDTSVVRYTPSDEFLPVLTTADLSAKEITINDLASSPGGSLYLATDDGIYIWRDGNVNRHLSRFEGLGTSEVIRTVYIDALGRVWFSSQGFVGYFYDESSSGSWVPFEPGTNAVTSIPATPEPIPVTTSVITPQATRQEQDMGTGGLAPILDPIIRAIISILSKLGIVPAPS